MSRSYPRNCWYVAATSDEVTGTPLGRRAVDQAVVLFRVSDGRAVALEDRCAHRPYPLSLGRVDGDTIVSGYTGFAYDASGACVRVPTQDRIPVGARVRAFPVHDDGTFVWAWLGDPARASLRTAPSVPWLADPAWASFGSQWETHAAIDLLQENFADISHITVVDPDFAPPVLRSAPPRLDVEVSETSVSFSRDYPPAELTAWHSELVGRPAGTLFRQRELGQFVTPGLWVDGWEAGEDGGGPACTFRFTHALTPIDATHTRHLWRVSRDFALQPDAEQTLRPMFEQYYRRVQAILETMQAVLDRDGPRPTVSVSADAAALQVRKIVRQMVADETPR
ncbi:aromatic ring-hydroxylating dioxygenase subunit alpha [Angustibacter luteus]|uniref:Aromatic ring-hydroxylating dioxygenase subunit alpha n=1 Tax=Angustibacter luteus TaxID=658456 RepID=A0ABW1JDR7_9ACTN